MYTKKQRIVAIIGIILLLLLYIINFFIGIFCRADIFPLFLASILATFFIPTIVFFYLKLTDYIKKKNDITEDENDW